MPNIHELSNYIEEKEERNVNKKGNKSKLSPCWDLLLV